MAESRSEELTLTNVETILPPDLNESQYYNNYPIFYPTIPQQPSMPSQLVIPPQTPKKRNRTPKIEDSQKRRKSIENLPTDESYAGSRGKFGNLQAACSSRQFLVSRETLALYVCEKCKGSMKVQGCKLSINFCDECMQANLILRFGVSKKH